MKRYILLITCTPLLILPGCTQRNTEVSSIMIPVATSSMLVADTTFLDSVSLFLPETKPNALIRGIDRVIAYKQRYLILDIQMKQVLCYDQAGKHLFTIHALGSGPGEYVNLFDIAIDRKEEKLLLLTYPPAIHCYTYEGAYECSYPLDGIYKSLAVTDEYIYLRRDTYTNNRLSDHSLLAIEKRSQRHCLLWKPLPEIAPYCTSGGMQMTGNQPVYLTRKFDNSIYRMKGDQIEEVYRIDWGKQAFPAVEEKRTYECAELNRICMEKRYVYVMTDLFETPEFLFFRTNQPGLYILSKKKKEIMYTKILMNTDYQLPLPNFIPVEGGDRKRIFFVYSSEMLKMQEKQNKECLNMKLESLLKQVSEDDNPVVFSYTVR